MRRLHALLITLMILPLGAVGVTEPPPIARSLATTPKQYGPFVPRNVWMKPACR